MSDANLTACVRCGGPLSSVGSNARCTYCGTIQPERVPAETKIREVVHQVLREDRNRNGVPDSLERPAPVVSPGTSPNQERVMLAVAGAALVGSILVGVSFALLRRPDAEPHVTVPTPVVTSPPRPIVPTMPTPTVRPTPTAAPTPTPVKVATTPPKPALTPEQWGRKVVAGAKTQKAIQSCVEFDLWKKESVPKAYSVTVKIGTDLLPDTSVYALSPKPTNGLSSCVKLALFNAFNDARSAPPVKEPFTFTTSFAFPNAQPNPGNLPTRDWD